LVQNRTFRLGLHFCFSVVVISPLLRTISLWLNPSTVTVFVSFEIRGCNPHCAERTNVGRYSVGILTRNATYCMPCECMGRCS